MASRASQSAIKAIEKKGGKIVCKFYNELALRDCVDGRTDRVSAAPTRREDIGEYPHIVYIAPGSRSPAEWYTDRKHRGYLNSRVLQSLGDLPFVEGRWHALATQLSQYRTQKFGQPLQK